MGDRSEVGLGRTAVAVGSRVTKGSGAEVVGSIGTGVQAESSPTMIRSKPRYLFMCLSFFMGTLMNTENADASMGT